MPIPNPSQYDCDNMQKGDCMYIRKRGAFYKFIRKYFRKNCIKIKFRKYPHRKISPIIQEYQEDCVLFRLHEIRCMRTLESIPYIYLYKSKPVKKSVVKRIDISLNDLSIHFDDKCVVTLPIQQISRCIIKNKETLKNSQELHEMEDKLKFKRKSEQYYKDYINKHNIKNWAERYCYICGKPLLLEFEDDYINIKNECECGHIQLKKDKITYTDLADYIALCSDAEVSKVQEEFWFKKEK